MLFSSYLSAVQSGESLSEADMASAMEAIMRGQAAESDMAAFLSALAQRGETVDEITGAARVMRARALKIDAPPDAVDCCGTGGDNAGTLNISTAVAIVAAACGVPVAKHGNRASSSKSGSADVLEALGVNLDVTPERAEQALREIGFAFLMATRHHRAARQVNSVRKALGFRTFFNLLGPLVNPAGTKRQLIGVFDRQWLVPFAEVLKRLGSERAWVVHGRDGLDEITVTGETDVAVLEGGRIREMVVHPFHAGLPTHPATAIMGGTVTENADALRRLLDGTPSAYRDIVLMNAAAVLIVHGKSRDLGEGAGIAAQAIDWGKAQDLLTRYRDFVA